jgi:hypothetical protein
MTERDYIKATNRVKVSMALMIMRDVLPGEHYGITESEASSIKRLLCEAEEKLFSLVEIKEDE